MDAPRKDVREAFLESVTRIRRRVEIYESDAETPWRPDLWDDILIEGTVSTDTGRDERRTFDVTLFNVDHQLDPQTDKLWYDKVFKIFSGIDLDQRPKAPKVAIVEEYDSIGQAQALKVLMAEAGHRQVRFIPLAATYADVEDYDILISISSDYPRKLALLNEAYSHGKSIWTMAPKATAAQVPECLLTVAPTATTTISASTFAPRSTTVHPLMNGWSAWAITYPFVYNRISAAKTGAAVIAEVSDTENVVRPSIIATQAQGDSRWVHMQQSRFTDPTFVSEADRLRCGEFLVRAVGWLDTYVPLAFWEAQLCECMADSIEDIDRTAQTIQVIGRDYVMKCQGLLPTTTTFDETVAVEELIKTMALNSGIKKFALPTTGQVLGKSMTWEGGTKRWDIMKEIATANNYEIYFTADGFLTMRQFRDPLLTAPTLVLVAGDPDDPDSIDLANLVTRGVKSSGGQIYNHVIVVGESSDSTVPSVWAEAKNEVEGSPTSIQKLGTRTMPKQTSNAITTTAQAQELADALLKVAALEEFELNFGSVLYPWVEVGDIVELNDKEAWGPTRYLLASLSFPLDMTPMSGNGKRVTQVV